MKKYLLRLGLAAITFSIGACAASTWLIDFFYNPVESDEIREILFPYKKPQRNFPPKEDQSFTFTHTGGIACGFDFFGNRTSQTSYTASDGTVISSTSIYLKSEKSALKRFQQFQKKAEKIIETAPYLDYWKRKIGEKVIIENEGEVSLITLSGSSLTILTSNSLIHVKTFNEQQESLERSLVINKLKP